MRLPQHWVAEVLYSLSLRFLTVWCVSIAGTLDGPLCVVLAQMGAGARVCLGGCRKIGKGLGSKALGSVLSVLTMKNPVTVMLEESS